MNDLTNRLKKRLKHLSRQAERERTDAFRIYDQDIPEFPFAIDKYADCLVVHDYRYPEKRPDYPDMHLSQALSDATGIPFERQFVKPHVHQKGSRQYNRLSHDSTERIIREGDIKYITNLSDYLDTGLFLDHRPMRRWLTEHANGARVLNLFCYTGSLSIAAAAGGAKLVVSVDLSNTYLNWLKRNIKANDQSPQKHQLVKEDTLAYVKDLNRKENFDVIILDPPSFSNSKLMEKTFDVQRDHGELINAFSKHLASGGQLIFSTNKKRFKLDSEKLANLEIEDWTKPSIPFDFSRKTPHYTFFIRTA